MARVLAISSQVVYGPVGLNCIVPALQSLGHEVMPLPTTLLSNHPGHGRPSGRATPVDDMAAMLQALARIGAFDGLDAVITGYFASAAQVALVADFIRKLDCKTVLVDPVIGDDGVLYVGEDIAVAMRDLLVPLASIITPNAFELSWLSGGGVQTVEDALAAARRLNIYEVIATSVLVAGDELATLRIAQGQCETVSAPKLSAVPNGTGDLFSGLYLAHRLAGDAKGALALAHDHVQRAIALSHGTKVLAVAEALFTQKP